MARNDHPIGPKLEIVPWLLTPSHGLCHSGGIQNTTVKLESLNDSTGPRSTEAKTAALSLPVAAATVTTAGAVAVAAEPEADAAAAAITDA